MGGAILCGVSLIQTDFFYKQYISFVFGTKENKQNYVSTSLDRFLCNPK